MSGFDREVAPPREVLSSTEMVDFDREVTPRGAFCRTGKPDEPFHCHSFNGYDTC